MWLIESDMQCLKNWLIMLAQSLQDSLEKQLQKQREHLKFELKEQSEQFQDAVKQLSESHKVNYSIILLGECRTLWGEHEQAACILATKERMRYQKLLSVSEVTTVGGSLWWHIVSTSLAGPFPPGLVFCSLVCLLHI